MLHAVIMAGGAGTRFWPLSRAARPKQLLNLIGARSMIQATIDRLGDLVPRQRVLVLTNKALVRQLAEQLPELAAEAIVGEPCKRDTAPCIGLAAALLRHQDADATMVVMPADHVIQPAQQFRAAVQRAVDLVQQQPARIVTFGIRPTYAAESFGYIERGEALAAAGDESGDGVFRVRMFREKPTAEVAEQYLAAGDFYWNSGIFVWKASTVLDALSQYEPEMYRHLDTIASAIGSDHFAATMESEFAAIDGKSIDYAVMERYPEVVVIEAPFDWDDVGSWQSLARLRDADQQGNTVSGRHLGLDTRGCIIRGEPDHLVVTVGMEDCIIVHTPDATLVARKRDEEAIRQVVALLKEQGADEYL